MSEPILNIKKVEYHRNGVGGSPFYVVAFTDQEGTVNPRNMLGFVFSTPGHVAVIDVDLAAKGILGMFESEGNAWRGDVFEPELRKAIKEAKHD